MHTVLQSIYFFLECLCVSARVHTQVPCVSFHDFLQLFLLFSEMLGKYVHSLLCNLPQRIDGASYTS